MLANLIAGSTNDLPSILSGQHGAGSFPTLEARGLDKVKLSTLRFILLDQRPENDPVIQYIETFQEVADDPENGPWVYLVPDDLVNLLAALPMPEVPMIAEAWAATEEAQLDHWIASDLETPLREVSAFASAVLARGSKLVLRICL